MAISRIAFICPVQCDPREQRRAASLLPFFSRSVAICYQRGYYQENTWPDGVELVLLPKAIDGNHLHRLLGFPRAFTQAARTVRSHQGAQVIYAFGLESGIVANLTRRRGDRVVWEIADLPAASMTKRWKRVAVRFAEKWILARSDLLVMTSQAMFDAYYRNMDPHASGKLVIVENRLAETYRISAGSTKQKVSRPIRLAWSGFLRNIPFYERLLKAVAEDGGRRVSLGIWGGGPGAELAARYAGESPYIEFHGAYKESPQTLREIHEKSDVHVVLDDGANLNVQCALPNRLFYCLAYETPLIVTAGTVKETRVKTLDVGLGVDEKNVDWSALFDRLADGDLVNKWLANLKAIPDEMRFMDSAPLVLAIQKWLET